MDFFETVLCVLRCGVIATIPLAGLFVAACMQASRSSILDYLMEV